jgi:hypothetical protein
MLDIHSRSHRVNAATFASLKPDGIVYFCCLAGARLSPEPRSLLNLLAFEVVRPLISITAHDSATVLLQSTKLL